MGEFKDFLAYLRKREGLSQADLAFKLDVTPSTIGNYESGTRKPTWEIEEAIADYFNVSLDFLRGIDSERRPINNDEFNLIVAFRNSDELTRQMVKRLLGVEKEEALKDFA